MLSEHLPIHCCMYCQWRLQLSAYSQNFCGLSSTKTWIHSPHVSAKPWAGLVRLPKSRDQALLGVRLRTWQQYLNM